ncbi:hypothetical protein KJ780_02915 [Candidatus Micrarchaeota archaeon]|nr:hypothetical protein [Candidatus Micrarchaeota archaeon]
MASLEERLSKIEQRNAKVESDKAWETSYTRRILIATFTYLAISLYFYAINLPNPWLNAIVPTLGFLLSTLTLHFFKKIWIIKLYKK